MNDQFSKWVVPRELLEALAEEADPPAPTPSKPRAADSSGSGEYSSRLLVDRWLDARGVAYRVKSEPDAHGRTVYVLKECPFDPAHADPDACVMQAVDGKMSAHCFHNSCQGRGWQAFKEKIGAPEADYYDPPLRSSKSPKPNWRSTSQATEHDQDIVESAHAAATQPSGSSSQISSTSDIVIDSRSLPVRETMSQITNVLLATGDCYRRADQVVRIHGKEITVVLTAPELSGLLNAHAEVLLVRGKDASEYRPLWSSPRKMDTELRVFRVVRPFKILRR